MTCHVPIFRSEKRPSTQPCAVPSFSSLLNLQASQWTWKSGSDRPSASTVRRRTQAHTNHKSISLQASLVGDATIDIRYTSGTWKLGLWPLQGGMQDPGMVGRSKYLQPDLVLPAISLSRKLYQLLWPVTRLQTTYLHRLSLRCISLASLYPQPNNCSFSHSTSSQYN